MQKIFLFFKNFRNFNYIFRNLNKLFGFILTPPKFISFLINLILFYIIFLQFFLGTFSDFVFQNPIKFNLILYFHFFPKIFSNSLLNLIQIYTKTSQTFYKISSNIFIQNPIHLYQILPNNLLQNPIKSNLPL